jgi:hypothetical protein
MPLPEPTWQVATKHVLDRPQVRGLPGQSRAMNLFKREKRFLVVTLKVAEKSRIGIMAQKIDGQRLGEWNRWSRRILPIGVDHSA